MNYIGSKTSLIGFIRETMRKYVGNLNDYTLCDLFAGTGAVGRNLAQEVKSVIANDLETYSFVLCTTYLCGYNKEVVGKHIEIMNALTPDYNGLISQYYTESGGDGRKYFTIENGGKIDAARLYIDGLYLGPLDRNALICSVMEAADKVANTTSVYGAFLKNYKKSAIQSIEFKLPAGPEATQTNKEKNLVYQMNANNLVKMISGDILYLDPPYNARQYGANYHVLNTICEYKPIDIKGVTGLGNYNKSIYCKKGLVSKEFEDLIANANFKWIFLSYNNEGLMSCDEIKEIMSRYGDYCKEEKEYQRYKADSNRDYLDNKTIEYLHILKKS